MKRLVLRGFLVLILIAFLVANAFGEESNPHQTQVYAGFSTGSLVNGNQYDWLHDGLNPRPYQYGYVAPTFGLRHYFLPFLGFEANGDVYGNVTVSAVGASPLECYRESSVETGAVLRYVFNPESENSVETYLGLGGNYNWFQYSPKYQAIFPSGFVLYDVSSDFGYYGKVGACYYLVGPLFLDAQLEYTVQRNLINRTNTVFQGGYWKVNIHVGFGL